MPQYKYKREDGSTFTTTHSIHKKLKECPTTGQSVTRLISKIAGIKYKGAGWTNKTSGWKASGPRPLSELAEQQRKTNEKYKNQ